MIYKSLQAATDQLTIPLNRLTCSNPKNELPAQTIITNQPLSVQTISSTLQLEAKSTVEALIHQPTNTQYEFSRFCFLTNISNIMCILASVWLGNFFGLGQLQDSKIQFTKYNNFFF